MSKPLAQQVREALVLVAVGQPDEKIRQAIITASVSMTDAGAERLSRLLK